MCEFGRFRRNVMYYRREKVENKICMKFSRDVEYVCVYI